MSLDSPVTTAERLVRARHSHDLSIEERRRGDADYLAAAGMATRHMRVGGSLLHLQVGGDAAALGAAELSVRSLVKAMSARRNWRLNGEATDRVAKLSLLHHIAPVCPTCHGRKFMEVPGTGRLSGQACGYCHGTGVRPLGRRNQDEVAAVLVELAMIESVVQRSVGRLVR